MSGVDPDESDHYFPEHRRLFHAFQPLSGRRRPSGANSQEPPRIFQTPKSAGPPVPGHLQGLQRASPISRSAQRKSHWMEITRPSSTATAGLRFPCSRAIGPGSASDGLNGAVFTSWPTSAAVGNSAPPGTTPPRENRQALMISRPSRGPHRAKVTSPRHLGVQGGSNGGLLVGVMLTQPGFFRRRRLPRALARYRRYNHLLAGGKLDGRIRQPGHRKRLGLHP